MSNGANVLDKPLTVKCKLEHTSHQQNFTYRMARNCAYAGLRERVKHLFQLAGYFHIQWEDDNHEKNLIDDQSTLDKAIDHYHSGDEGITLEVEICVAYDGPSLSSSDTTSQASRNRRLLEGSQMSVPSGAPRSSHTDSMTMGSKGIGSHPVLPQDRVDSSHRNATSRPGSSFTNNKPILNPPLSRILELSSSRASSAEETTEISNSSLLNMINGHSSGSIIDSERPDPDDQVAVLARLRLEEQRNPDLSQDRSHQRTWLQQQNTLRIRATPGTVPPLNKDTPSSKRGSGPSNSTGGLGSGVVGGTRPEQDEAQSCSACQSQLSVIRYKCGECDDLTICQACYNQVHDIHPTHPFLEQRVNPSSRLRSFSGSGSITSTSVSTVLPGNQGGGRDVDIEEPHAHAQACNSCGERIIGVRYQCLNCPSLPNSFNLCSDCEITSYKVHDPMHVFLKIPRPVDISGPLQSGIPVISILYKSPAGPTPGSPVADMSDPAAYLRDLTHHRKVRCDRHVARPIVGKWYHCAHCPMDLCEECEALDSHDITHFFLVFKAPVDMKAFRRHFVDSGNPAGSSPALP